MNKQERIEALAKKTACANWEDSRWEHYVDNATIAVEFMEKEYAELVEAAERQLRNYPDSTGHWIGIALSNLKEPSHD